MVKRLLIVILFVCMLCSAEATYIRFRDASEDVKDYVVDCVTNCIRTSIVAVMYDDRFDADCSKANDLPMPWSYESVLSLNRRRCLAVLRGNPVIANKRCYLYENERRTGELPLLYETVSRGCTGSGDQGAKFYVDVNDQGQSNLVWIAGRSIWRFFPPYDPYASFQKSTTRLMLLEPVHHLQKGLLRKYQVAQIDKMVGSESISIGPDAIAEKLGISSVFEDQVYRMREGCSFHVNAGDVRGTPDTEPDSRIMHLSKAEVSELVYLSYEVNGKGGKAYDDALLRNPTLLQPVKEIKTELGRRIGEALGLRGQQLP